MSNEQKPICPNACQFAKYDAKLELHVCSLGITCPGPDCTFRGFHQNMAMTYIRSLDGGTVREKINNL